MGICSVRYLLILLFISSLNASAEESGFHDVLSFNVGMISHSVTENESSLVSTDDSSSSDEEEAATSTPTPVSAISFNLNWEFETSQEKSYFVEAFVPMMTTGGAGVFLGGVGMNWYLNDLGAKYTYMLNGTEFTIIPKLKYYWGASTGIGYIIYNTESAKKSDVFFDLGIHGGGVYGFNNTKGIKFEVGASRATGVATTGIKINLFLGITQYL